MNGIFMLKLPEEVKKDIERLAFEKRIYQAKLCRIAITKFLEEEKNVIKLD